MSDVAASAPIVRASVALSLADLAGPATPLAPGDMLAAAKLLGVGLAKVQACEAVESRGRGFGSDGRPIILFEPHIFHKLTGGKFSDGWPTISYPTWGTLPYPGSQSQRYAQLDQAMRLDPDAALKSASWGMYQIMGYNFRAAGGGIAPPRPGAPSARPGLFATVQDFVRAMVRSEGDQLLAFARMILSQPAMTTALRLGDWAGYARLYNGPGYAQHGYDQKLKTAFARFRAASASA